MPNDSALLSAKKIPTDKAVGAAALGIVIISTIAYLLHLVSYELEVHFHIFHPENAKPNPDGSAPVARPGLLIALVLMYPLLTILGMVLIIPLVMYVTDHAPFQSLNMLRPDHFIQLVVQVYRAWLSSAGGKLKPKDL